MRCALQLRGNKEFRVQIYITARARSKGPFWAPGRLPVLSDTFSSLSGRWPGGPLGAPGPSPPRSRGGPEGPPGGHAGDRGLGGPFWGGQGGSPWGVPGVGLGSTSRARLGRGPGRGAELRRCEALGPLRGFPVAPATGRGATLKATGPWLEEGYPSQARRERALQACGQEGPRE